MIVSFKFGALFKLFSAIIFLGLGVLLMAGYQVAYTQDITFTTGSTTTTGTDERFLIKDQGTWLAWIFIGLGVFSAALFFIEMIPR